ncbi:putative RNase3 domain-containing protein [Rosellinia necatrix]|uniref:Putative RNase3 domain-containing protein n=1 Tax=Rosellinia necatrix TaxID=77044 RepID=A0A1W2TCC9_ROSNE|nr:putative RNase3 domain-containing protein [Rosellinia necatrix]
MSKRSFEEYSTVASNAGYNSVLDHADKLLKAAESLKRDLERLANHGSNPSSETILSTLKQHNVQIHSATRALSQDESAGLSETEGASHKTQKVDQSQSPSNHRPQSGLPIPRPEMLSRWVVEDVLDKDVLPPLPPVLDPVLEKAARTHAGVAKTLGEMDYERLEWIGDAYLYLASSALIYQTFPNLPAGRCSQLRERLIKNETLSDFTVRYNLDKRARLPAEFHHGGRPSATGAGTSASKKERKKILGDLLEAYTAAAILSDAGGLPNVIAWLKSIWGTALAREIRDEHKKPVTQHPKSALVQAIGAKGVTISYRDEGKPKTDKNSGLPWFTVGAYYDGLGETNLNLGYGSGLSKTDAGAKAAAQALENKKLMKRLRQLKDDMNATLQKARDSQDK